MEMTKLHCKDVHSFIHSGHFYSAPSSPLPLRGAPDYSTDTVSEFHAEALFSLLRYIVVGRGCKLTHCVFAKYTSTQNIRAYSTLTFFKTILILPTSDVILEKIESPSE